MDTLRIRVAGIVLALLTVVAVAALAEGEIEERQRRLIGTWVGEYNRVEFRLILSDTLNFRFELGGLVSTGTWGFDPAGNSDDGVLVFDPGLYPGPRGGFYYLVWIHKYWSFSLVNEDFVVPIVLMRN